LGSPFGSSQIRRPGAFEAQHRAGIGAMRRDLAPVFEHDVGEEALITADQAAGDQGTGEFHGPAASPHRSRGQAMPNPTAAMLTIGDEILSGRTRDANLPHLALALAEKGIDLREARVVPDVAAEIAAAVNALRARYDHVFTSGGIGPTHDDITADSVAAAFGVADRRARGRPRDPRQPLPEPRAST
jgi:hypothetical protein